MKQHPKGTPMRRTLSPTFAAIVCTVACFQVGARTSSAQSDFFGLRITDAPSAEAESAVVKVPISFVIKELKEEGGIGVRVRTPVYFAWNRVAIDDIGGEDIARSLKTLTVTPGIELQIPAGYGWLVRPYVEFGYVSALDVGEHTWLLSVGSRASATWDVQRWRIMGGGRLQYSVGLTEDWRFHDDLGSIDLGGGASLPLWFETSAGRPRAGLFFFPRFYFDEFVIDGADDGGLAVDFFMEVGASFEWPESPKILGIRLPSWYGLGYRFAENYGAVRVYLGFPF